MSMRKKRADQTADTGIRVTTYTDRGQGPDPYKFWVRITIIAGYGSLYFCPTDPDLS